MVRPELLLKLSTSPSKDDFETPWAIVGEKDENSCAQLLAALAESWKGEGKAPGVEKIMATKSFHRTWSERRRWVLAAEDTLKILGLLRKENLTRLPEKTAIPIHLPSPKGDEKSGEDILKEILEEIGDCTREKGTLSVAQAARASLQWHGLQARPRSETINQALCTIQSVTTSHSILKAGSGEIVKIPHTEGILIELV